MMSARAIHRIVDSAESTFQECWSILVCLKEATPDARLPTFQALLGAELLAIRNAEESLAQERKALIARKRSITKKYFTHRMRTLPVYLSVLRKTAAIGRGLGDAFAWFFYTNDRKLLAAHAQQPLIRSLPSGIGGLGELEFVRGVGKVQGMLILHHGITTILRLGDISLIDLKKWRVVALGELKTQETSPGSLAVNCHWVGSTKRWRPKVTRVPQAKDPLPQNIRARLIPQMRRMASSFSQSLAKMPGMTAKLSGEMYYGALEETLVKTRRKAATYAHAGGGLLICCIPVPGRRLIHRFRHLSGQELNGRVRDLETEVRKLVPAPDPLNALVIDGIYWNPFDETFPGFLLGTVPQFWWPITPQVMRKLLFLEVIVATFFNPAHLLHELEAGGHRVTALSSGGYRIELARGGAKIETHNFSYFGRLVSQALHSEKLVAEMMRRSSTSILKRGFPMYTQVDIHYEQGFPPGSVGPQIDLESPSNSEKEAATP